MEEKIQFDAKDFEKMQDKELHLMVYDKVFKNIIKRLSNEKRAKEVLPYEGSINEIIERSTKRFIIYNLGKLTDIKFEDGTQFIPKNSIYIFKIETVNYENNIPVLKGIAHKHYFIDEDRIGEQLEKKLLLTVGKVNLYKIREELKTES